MNRTVSAVIFALGLAAVAWVGLGFVGHSVLALGMTLLIAAVYLLGAREVWQFREATAVLRQATATLDERPEIALDDWLDLLPSALRHPVRQRIEGGRAPLPGLTLTPYLVGLLVMLGMLGTFLGMVVTFKGAVFALEGSTDLQAIRGALAAPIKGLGLSFGTSVVGVAASAMLGLLSALGRRERLEAAQRLDQALAGRFPAHSRRHQQQQSVSALQALSQQLESRHQALSAQLLAQQQDFHQQASQAYRQLAQDVGQSLERSLAGSASAATESLRPLVETAMAGLAEASQLEHERLGRLAQSQVDALSERFAAVGQQLGAGWSQAQQSQVLAQERLLAGLEHSLQAVGSRFEQGAVHLLASADEAASQARAEQARAQAEGQAAWLASLDGVSSRLGAEWREAGSQAIAQQQRVCDALEKTAADFSLQHGRQAEALLERLHQLCDQAEAAQRQRLQDEARWSERQAEDEQQRLQAWAGSLARLLEQLHSGWQTLQTQTEAQQARICDTLEQRSREVLEQGTEHSRRTLAEWGRLSEQSEALVRSRLEAETVWQQQQGQRLLELTTVWREEMAALKAQEAAQGQAALDRLAGLQTAMASQLATLGAALEAPMDRLMRSAAEVPQAAAGLIGELRQEMSRLAERDRQTLEERDTLMQRLSALLQAAEQGMGGQRAAVEALQASAIQVLDDAGQRFTASLAEQGARAEHFAAHLTSSAVELSSLGQAFHHGVQLFSSSNERLVEGLQRVETAVAQSTARSDEQLAYYVAQAREVIDLSISSQQGIVEELRQLQLQAGRQAEGVAG